MSAADAAATCETEISMAARENCRGWPGDEQNRVRAVAPGLAEIPARGTVRWTARSGLTSLYLRRRTRSRERARATAHGVIRRTRLLVIRP